MQGQLALIFQDEVSRQPTKVVYDTVSNVYLLLESETKRNEEQGLMWVDEHKIDVHTLVRNFASVEKGLVASLIVCGGVATDIRLSNKHKQAHK